MKIGIFFLNLKDKNSTSEISLNNMLETVSFVDTKNSIIDSVFVSENHFSPNGIVGSPLTTSSFLLGLTNNIKIGSLNHIITTHHPVRIAEEACLLDQMSEGRFILGFSDSEKKSDMRFFNRETKSQQDLFEVSHQIIDDALTTGYCHPDNNFYSFPKISVNPHAYTSGGPQQYVCATSDTIVKWAARRALPLILKWDDNMLRKEEYTNLYTSTANQEGIDISHVGHKLSMLVNTNNNATIAKDQLRRYLSNYEQENYTTREIDEKIESIIKDNAVGTLEQALDTIDMAMKKTGAKDILLSFESISESRDRMITIDILSRRIRETSLALN